MKNFLFCLLLTIFSITAMAQEISSIASAKPSQTAADVLELKETTFDFGKIPQGKPVTHIFAIHNGGSDTLKINNVQATCGCTTPEWEKDKVQAPGENTAINVGYNAAAEGAFTKFITIAYNGDKTKQLTIKGEVWKTPLTSAPENSALKSLREE